MLKEPLERCTLCIIYMFSLVWCITLLPFTTWSTAQLDFHPSPDFITPCPAVPVPAHHLTLWLFGSRAPQVGDQILEVNGRSFLTIPHDEAVRALKSSRHLMMTVKDVGRLPHARTVVGETKWIASSQITDSSASSSVAGWDKKRMKWFECFVDF